MKFSVNQSELQNALAIVLKGTSTKSTLPVLAGILISTEDDNLILQSTNLELSIKYKIAALVDEPGKMVVPGKLFFDIVKNMNDAAVHITSLEDSASILCDSSSFTIRTLDSSDFPAFPNVEISQEIHVPFETFASMIKKVSKSVSRDETKAAMTGINVSLENGTLTMVSTDSYRLSLASTPIENSEADNFQAVISANFMADIMGLPKTSDEITLALAENQIVVTYQNSVFINRRIESSFPAYQRIIPTSAATSIRVPRQQLIGAIRRASLLGSFQGSAGGAVKLSIDMPSRTMQLSSSQDSGSLQETIPVDGEGDNAEVAFNCAYLIDGLSSMDEDTIVFELAPSNRAGVFKSKESEDFLYLVMPMRG